MSEEAKTAPESTEETGVENMSLSDAINFSENGVKPTAPVKEEEAAEEKKVVVDEAETTIEPKVKVEDAVIPAQEKPIETKAEVKPEVKPEAPKSAYEDLMDDEDKAYFNFKKSNPGTTRADYQESKVDYDSLDRKDLLRKSLREKYNLSEDDAKLDEYITDELGIPMDVKESEMSLTERVALRKQTDEYVNSKKAQQQKWNESKVDEKVVQPKEEVKMVTLEDGSTIEESVYNKKVEDRNKYLKNNEEALNRVSATSFKIEVDDNGSKRELEYSYTFDKDDKHRMQSLTTDVMDSFNKAYTTKEGFDHDSLNVNKAWEDPQLRSKMLKSFAQSIYAEAFEESLKDRGNVTIGQQKGLSQQETKGYKIVPLTELLNS